MLDKRAGMQYNTYIPTNESKQTMWLVTFLTDTPDGLHREAHMLHSMGQAMNEIAGARFERRLGRKSWDRVTLARLG